MVAGDDHDRVFFARDVVRLLVKALRTRRLYEAPEHPYVKTACEELQRSVRSFIAAHGTLRMDVTKETFLLDQQPLYEERGAQEGNVASRLFLAGLRELALHEGIQPPETLQLLSILGARFDTADLGTLLESAELKHVEYVCLDELAEGWDRPEGLSKAALDRIMAMNERAEALIERLGPKLAAGTEMFELSDSAEELDAVSRIRVATAVGNDDDEDGEAALLAVSPSSLERFKEKARATGPDELVQALITIVLDGLSLEPEAIGDARACWFLAEVPKAALARNNLLLLAATLERYERELAGAPATEVVGPLRAALAELAKPASVQKLTELACAGAAGGPPALCHVLRVMGAPGISGGVEAYAKATAPELRDALERFLGEQMASHPEPFRRLVEPAVRADAARWCLFQASKVLKGPALEKLLEAGTKHTDAEVRRYAEFTYRTQTGRGRVKSFIDSLAAPQADERIRAARQLAKEKDPQGLAELRRLVEDQGFLSKAADEKKAFLEAIAEISGKAAIGFLKGQAERKTGIFRASAGAEVRSAAEEVIRKLQAGELTPPSAPAPRADWWNA